MANIIDDILDSQDITNLVTDDPQVVKRVMFHSSGLNILQMNIRSINKNFDNFLVQLSSFQTHFDVLILTECWITDTYTHKNIPSFHVFSTKSSGRQNDGVVVYVSEQLKATATELDLTDANCLKLDIRLQHHTICILSIYRSPSIHNITPFLDSLRTVLQNHSNQRVVLAGDLNINTLETNPHRQLDDYENLMAEFGLRHCITSPTRERELSSTCIDHILTNITTDLRSLIFQSSVTDHYITMLHIELQRPTKQARQHVFQKIDYNLLLENMANVDWTDVLHEADPDLALQLFLNKLNTNIQLCSSLVTVPRSQRKLKPWITIGLIRCIAVRNRLQKRSRLNPDNAEYRIIHRRYRQTLNTVLRRTKKLYYTQKLEGSNFDPKTFWKVVKEIGHFPGKQQLNFDEINHEGQKLTFENNPVEMANAFNNFFVSNGPNLAKNILHKLQTTETDLASDEGPNHPDSMFLHPVTADEIIQIITKFKTESASGPDNIGPKIYKLLKHCIADPLAHLINLSFSSGVFPNYLKAATVVPVFKNGPKDCISNFRPISLLNTISKIYEAAMKSRLSSFLENQNLLSPSQYGFRPGRGTNDAILKLTEVITNNVDSNKKCLAVFLDLAKAFDTVSHKILLAKLHKMGVRGLALQWFQSYLRDRKQHVRLGDTSSSNPEDVTYGVPQGTVLAPLLFLIYVNSLCDLNINGSIISFADDTAIVWASDSWEDVFDLATREMEVVQKHLDKLLLSLNTSKTNLMLFSSSNLPDLSHLSFVIHSCTDRQHCNCPLIVRLEKIKYLGIFLDSKLSWKYQVEHVVKKIRKSIFLFKELSHILDHRRLLQAYYSLCQSYFIYGNLGWGGTHKTFINRLLTTQKLILRIIYHRPRLYPSAQLFAESGVLDIRQLYVKSVLVHFKQHFAESRERSHNYNTRTRSLCLPPRMNKCFGQRHYIFLGSKFYNSLPQEIQSVVSISKFKNKVHRWIISLGYNGTLPLFEIAI